MLFLQVFISAFQISYFLVPGFSSTRPDYHLADTPFHDPGASGTASSPLRLLSSHCA